MCSVHNYGNPVPNHQKNLLYWIIAILIPTNILAIHYIIIIIL